MLQFQLQIKFFIINYFSNTILDSAADRVRTLKYCQTMRLVTSRNLTLNAAHIGESQVRSNAVHAADKSAKSCQTESR